MARPPLPLDPEFHGESLSTAAARNRGLATDRLRRRDIEHPFHGVVVFGGRPSSVVDRAWAYAQVMADVASFSHSTAALLHGLPLPRALEGAPLHVTVPPGCRAPRSRGVIGHQRDLDELDLESLLLPGRTGELLPLRVTSIGATLMTVATQVSEPDLTAIIDAALYRDAEATRAACDRMLARSARRAGTAALRRARHQARVGVRSRAETHLRVLLVAAGLPEPAVAPDVDTSLGELHPDLAWPDFRVLVEYEGDRHRTDQRRFASDIERFDAFTESGWSAARATQHDVYVEPRRIIETIAQRLRAAGWRPSRSVRSSIRPLAFP